MDFAKVSVVYFSATNVSKQYALAMAQALDKDITQFDLTLPAGRDVTPPVFPADTLVIVAMPVYSGRIIPVARPFLEAMTGNQTPCIIIATYGNRHYDDALAELEDLMVMGGFTVVGAAAVVGRHSLSGAIAGHRPDQTDLQQAADFARNVASKEGPSLPLDCIPGNRPYKQGGNPNPFHSTANDHCVDCKLCAKRCPMGVISLEDVKELARPATDCILCNRCIVNCPKGARVFDFQPYQTMVANCIANFAKPDKENVYFL